MSACLEFELGTRLARRFFDGRQIGQRCFYFAENAHAHYNFYHVVEVRWRERRSEVP